VALQIEEQTGLILFSVQSLRLEVAAAVLEIQDKTVVLPQELVVVDLKTVEEVLGTLQQHLHHKELMAVVVVKGTPTTEAAEAEAEVQALLVDLVLDWLVLVLAEMELHQILLRAVQLSLMLVAEVAVARFVLPAEAEAVLAVLVEVVKDVISHPRRSLVQQAVERQT
jgi:hypothetical protein